ncbi:MAG: translation initiation factor IF-3 [Bacteroidota bacterium]|nr:translation initiation factor IF-3 [Bacteroidota bacterium]
MFTHKLGDTPIKEKRPRLNEEIRGDMIRVIEDGGGQIGVMTPREAHALAIQKGKDLIEVVPNAVPPVCKIMDFGKFKYELQKKEKLQKKHQHVSQLKELRFHPNTDTHDFEFKTKHAIQFLEDGDKVKATVIFKGREVAYKEQGEELLNQLTERLSNISKVDQPLKMEGRFMVIIFTPDKSAKSKSEKQKQEQSN